MGIERCGCARSSVGLECLTTDQEAGGSSPSGRIVKESEHIDGIDEVAGRVAQLVRALR